MLDHRVDDFGGPQKFSLERPPVHVQGNGLLQIALRHCRDCVRDGGGWPQEIVDQRVDGALHLAPGSGAYPKTKSLPRSPFSPNSLPYLFKLLGHSFVRGHDLIEGIRQLAGDANLISRQSR